LEEELDNDSNLLLILFNLYSKYVTTKAAEEYGESKKEEK